MPSSIIVTKTTIPPATSGSPVSALRPVGIGANDGSGTWVTPGNIASQNGSNATVAVMGVGSGVVSSPGKLLATRFAFTPAVIPPATIIAGIEVDIFGSSSLLTNTTTVRPTIGVGSPTFSNLPFAYDGNLATGASFGASYFSGQQSGSATWYGFAAGPANPTTVRLNIKSQISVSPGVDGGAFLKYSKDGGVSYTFVYNQNPSRPATLDVINLPANQDLTKLRIQAGASYSSGLGAEAIQVFEIWVDIVTVITPNPASITVNMLKAGAVVGASRTASISGTSGMITLGGPLDMWATTWLAADVVDPNFGAAIVASVTNLAQLVNFFVDFVQIRVYGSLFGLNVAFTFRPSWKAPFVLHDGETNTTSGMSAGVYSITEDSIPLWETVITVSTGDPASAINLGASQTITVAIVNTLLSPSPPGGTSFVPNGPLATGSAQLIPLDNSPNQVWNVSVDVDGKSVALSVVLRYNEIAKYWVASISDNQGNLLVDSVPFLTGAESSQNLLRQFAYLAIGSAAIYNASNNPVDRPNSGNLGKDFQLLWGGQPDLTAKVGKVFLSTSKATAGSAIISPVPPPPPPSPTPVDLLTWLLIPTPNRAAFFVLGVGNRTYSMLDTDAGYPVGFPANTFFWIKNILGNPWDIEKYDLTHIKHWITEDGDAVDQAACVAAGYPSGCFLDPFAYKRFVTPVNIFPRFYLLGGPAVTLDTPGPNTVIRTTNCESTSANITLGDVRAVTSGPFKLSWAGSIDAGPGGGVADPVHGVPTLQNDYYYSGTIASGVFLNKETTYYVQGFGRVAWFNWKLVGGSWQLQGSAITNLLTAGNTTPVFPCGAGKIWWV